MKIFKFLNLKILVYQQYTGLLNNIRYKDFTILNVSVDIDRIVKLFQIHIGILGINILIEKWDERD
jgi:hypothetical protein